MTAEIEAASMTCRHHPDGCYAEDSAEAVAAKFMSKFPDLTYRVRKLREAELVGLLVGTRPSAAAPESDRRMTE